MQRSQPDYVVALIIDHVNIPDMFNAIPSSQCATGPIKRTREYVARVFLIAAAAVYGSLNIAINSTDGELKLALYCYFETHDTRVVPGPNRFVFI